MAFQQQLAHKQHSKKSNICTGLHVATSRRHDGKADLAQANEEVKDVGVVVQHCAGLHIGPELGLTLGVQGLVEVHLPLVKGILAQQHRPAEDHKG